jgi:hypothetical protein
MDSFLSRDNVDMLIEILLDDKPTKTQEDVNQIIQEINVFRNTCANAPTHQGLLELNQTFLTRMVQPQTQTQRQTQKQQPQQLKYKVEDLKAERLDFFDQQLAQKRADFESSITLKKPALPVFEDSQDGPISDMETLMAKTLAQRNLDIPYSNVKQASDWLSPTNTSVKSEKQEQQEEELNGGYDEQPTTKKISWFNSEEASPNHTTSSIFSKLKQTPSLETRVDALINRISALENKVEQLTKEISIVDNLTI